MEVVLFCIFKQRNIMMCFDLGYERTQDQDMNIKFSYLSNRFQTCTAPEQHLSLDMLSAAHAQQLQLSGS